MSSNLDNSNDNESQPLLHDANVEGDRRSWMRQGYHGIAVDVAYDNSARRQTRRFLSSIYGHYAILLLVSMDVACIFADFLISLYICDHSCGSGDDDGSGGVGEGLPRAQDALGIVGLVFSCLFMVELLASIWAFGFSFFKSKFHCFDAAIIVASFVIDVCLSNVLEEAASIVVILRLWRVVKIVEEFSAGASDQMEVLGEKIEKLEAENQELKRKLEARKDDSSGL